jgi:hypothetical protein
MIEQFRKAGDLVVLQFWFPIEQGRPACLAGTEKVPGVTISKMKDFCRFAPRCFLHLSENLRFWFFASQFAGNKKMIECLVNFEVTEHAAQAGIIVGKNGQLVPPFPEDGKGGLCMLGQFPAFSLGKKVPQFFKKRVEVLVASKGAKGFGHDLTPKFGFLPVIGFLTGLQFAKGLIKPCVYLFVRSFDSVFTGSPSLDRTHGWPGADEGAGGIHSEQANGGMGFSHKGLAFG